MRTKEVKLFQFDELSDEAKEKAREWYREASIGDDFWHENVIDDAKHVLTFAGFEIDKIYFSGFWSQGDGAQFEGSFDASKVNAAKMREECPVDTDLHAIADESARLITECPRIGWHVKSSGHYSHEMATEFSFNYQEEECDPHGDECHVDHTPANLDAFEEAHKENARDAMRWIYKQLEREYEWQNADEQVDDTIRANEYEFTEEGRINA